MAYPRRHAATRATARPRYNRLREVRRGGKWGMRIFWSIATMKLLPQRLKPHFFAIVYVRPKGRTLPIGFRSELVPAGAKAHLYLGRYGPTKAVP